MIKSFIHYLGNKFYHIKEIFDMLPRFNRGLDVFGGSGVVSMNCGLDYNDLDPYVARCFLELKQDELDEIIEKYGLDQDLIITAKEDGELKKRISPDRFLSLIKAYQETPTLALEFSIRHYCHNMATNNCFTKMTRGNAGYFRRPMITSRELFLNRKITHKNFRDIDFNEYDFLFLDPPYLACDKRLQYKGWAPVDETDLLDKLLNYKGKFLLMNYMNQHIEEYARLSTASPQPWLIKKVATKMNSEKFSQHGNAEYFVYNYRNGLFDVV